MNHKSGENLRLGEERERERERESMCLHMLQNKRKFLVLSFAECGAWEATD